MILIQFIVIIYYIFKGNSDHTMIKVVIMASIVLSITGAYVMFYKKKDSLNRNTTTDS